MNKLIKPFVCIMALTIPTLASAHIESNQVNENEVVVTYNAAEATTESVSIELERQVRRAAKKVCGFRKPELCRGHGYPGSETGCHQ